MSLGMSANLDDQPPMVLVALMSYNRPQAPGLAGKLRWRIALTD